MIPDPGYGGAGGWTGSGLLSSFLTLLQVAALLEGQFCRVLRVIPEGPAWSPFLERTQFVSSAHFLE